MSADPMLTFARRLAVWSFVAWTAGAAFAAEPVTSCGQVLRDGGFLTANLDCSAYTAGPALTIERGTLELGGFTLTGNEVDTSAPELESTVFCPRRCQIVGPGSLAGGRDAVVYALDAVTLRDATVTDATSAGYAHGIVAGKLVRVVDSLIEGVHGDAVNAGTRATVRRSTIRSSGSGGVIARKAATVNDSVIEDCGWNFPWSGIFADKVRARDVTISGTVGVGVIAGDAVKIRDSRVTGSHRSGIESSGDVTQVSRSDVSGNCVDPGTTAGSCADVRTCDFPRLSQSSCETSLSCSAPTATAWGVCALD